MEENEFDGILNEAYPSSKSDSLDPFGLILQNQGGDVRNATRALDRKAQMDSDPMGMNLKNFTPSQLREAGEAMTGLQGFYKESPSYDRVKRMSDRAIQKGEILSPDGKTYEKFSKDSWNQSALAFLGYNDFLYEKPIEGTGDARLDALETIEQHMSPGLITDYLRKFDDGQQFDFLTTAIDPITGEETLQRIRDTYKGATEKGYSILNQFGTQNDSDEIPLLLSFAKGGYNVLTQTDDVVLAFAKYAQDLTGTQWGNLDEIYEDVSKDTERTQILPSKSSEDFLSPDWWGSGAGSAFASLLQFGSVGRGIRGVTALAGMGKTAASAAVAGKIASWGSSGVIGFGYGYKEALDNGLTGGDALMFGTVVGALNTGIESFLGSKFDDFITGGGPKAVSKEVMKDLGGDVSEGSLKRYMAGATKYISEAGSRLSNVASEASEEVLQDVVEQGSRLAYNAIFADKDAIAGQGKFSAEEFDFMSTVSAGIFGGLAAAPFSTKTRTMAHAVMNGDGARVDAAINQGLTDGTITAAEAKTMKAQKDAIQDQYEQNADLIDNIGGEYQTKLKDELMQKIMRRTMLENSARNVYDGMGDMSPAEIAADTERKAMKEALDAEIAKASLEINKYKDPEYIRVRAAELKSAKEIAQENPRSNTGRIGALTSYTSDQTIEDTRKRIAIEDVSMFNQSAIARNSHEAANVASLFSGSDFDPSLVANAGKQFRSFGFQLSKEVNTMENRPGLLKMGFKEDELPMTSEEKLDAIGNPGKYSHRVVTAGFAEALAAAPGAYRIDKYKSILSGPSAGGLTPSQLASLDNSESLAFKVTPEQLAAITKIRDTAMPTNIILIDEDKPMTGFFSRAHQTLVVSGRINQTSNMGSLVHVMAHELGHAMFDRDLVAYHEAWLNGVNGKSMTPRQKAMASYFDQAFKLANLANTALANNTKYQTRYFAQQAKTFAAITDPKAASTAAINVVKEFFAEALGNHEFQRDLDSIDLNKPEFAEMAKRIGYNTENQFTRSKNTLLGEVFDLLGSIWQTLKGILTREDRTVLTEATSLMTNVQFNRYYVPTDEAAQNIKTTSLSISNYGGVNLFDGEQIDIDQMIGLLYRRLSKAGVRLSESDQKSMLGKIRQFVASEMTGEGKEVLGGSIQVVYFKSSDYFMIMWNDVAGQESTHRAFFDRYGRRLWINTNVTNEDSPMTVAKYNIMQAFKPGYAGQEAEHKRRVINNIEKARKEGFIGEAFLQYDPNHTWVLGNKVIQGQVRLMYTFSDGSRDTIGSVPDLGKARLATILQEGVEVKVKVSEDGPGSEAYVRYNQKGELTQVYPTNDTSIDKSKYKRERVAGKLKFNYVSSTINDDVSNKADSVDMVTADYRYQGQPNVSQEALNSGTDITDNVYTGSEFNAGMSLYDPNPDGVSSEAGPVDHRIQFIRDGLPRRMRRATYFYTGQVNPDMMRRMAADYNQKSAAYFAKTLPQMSEEAGKRLGFASQEEYNQYLEEVIRDIARDRDAEGNINAEDWSGMGGNPSGRISAGIKSDLEAINFTHEGRKHWIDFSEGKDILFDAADGTQSFDAMVDNLEERIKSKEYGGRRLAIAQAILNHWTEQNNLKIEGQEETGTKEWNAAKNSYWSQPASYIRLDAITMSPQGDSAFLFFNGESSYLNGRAQEYAAKIQLQVNKAIDANPGKSPKEIMDFLKAKMNQHFVDFMAKKSARGTNSTQAGVDRANALLKNQNGTTSTVVAKLNSFRTNMELSKFNRLGYKKTGVMAAGLDRMAKMFGLELNSGKGLQDYNAISDLLAGYLDFFGMEPAENLYPISADGRTQKYMVDLYKQLTESGVTVEKAQAEVQRKLDELPLNVYKDVQIKGKDGRYNQVPFVKFGLDFVDFMQFQIQNNLEGKDYDYNIGEMESMVGAIMKSEGEYRSPEFYFNANFEKEWALKIRSYTDTLVRDLSKENSPLLNEYMSNDLYKNNRFLKTIKTLNGGPAQFMLSGLRLTDGSSISQSYNESGSMDFLYTNLAGFVHSYNSPTYYHVGDVSSDKPRNMAYKMLRITKGGLKSEIQSILDSEKSRMAERKAKGEPVFNIENTFYGGKSASEIMSQIEQEGIASYKKLKADGMKFPVPPRFAKDLKQRNLAPADYARELAQEQQRLFMEWRENYIINRYHLSMVTMGDYMYYKQDELVDLNKRNAGTHAPSQHGVFGPHIKVVLMEDIEVGPYEVVLPSIAIDENGVQRVVEGTNNLSKKVARTDAQGYVSETFANKIIKAYGSFAGYEKIFKPVVFGVNKADIANGKPLYLKLSMTVLPNPETNPQYYLDNPGQVAMATKLYESKADFLTFRSAVKTQGQTFGNIDDETYSPIKIDSDLFGLQNNPYHDPNDDENVINGMVQFFKMLGDNGSAEAAALYHEIESGMIDIESGAFLQNRMGSEEKAREFVRENLMANEYSTPIADFVDAGVKIFDNPITSKNAENVVNAGFRKRTGLVKKSGDKLVNVSDFGFQRPSVDLEKRAELLAQIDEPNSEYIKDLAWLGPRTPGQLTLSQLQSFVQEVAEGTASVNAQHYIVDSEGKIRIYPAEVVVPKGNYQIGDRLLATRIPTSKRSNIIPGIVVGHMDDSQGNTIAVGKPGTAILGFDFDVDGLFVWRERASDKAGDVNKMFNVAYSILTDARNYNDMTSPTVTDQIAAIVSEIKALEAQKNEGQLKFNKFSPERQVELKELNMIGKDMIGVTANRSGIHSVMQQTGGNPYLHTDFTNRAYRYNNQMLDKFVATATDEDGVERKVTDSYSEFLNAAADNVKLQQLGAINANPMTGSVLFDMMSHGVPMNYAVMFINQPVIKEFVRITKNKNSVSYGGDRTVNVAQQLFTKIETAIQALGGKYSGYKWNGTLNGTSVNTKNIRKFSGGVMTTSDNVELSLDALKAGIKGTVEASSLSTPNENRFHQLEQQLVVLDKFMYYKSLAKISADAGKVVTLTSGYPKTFVELLDTKNKIDVAINGEMDDEGNVIEKPKMSNAFLNNPTVGLQLIKLNQLIESYADKKAYATKELVDFHKKISQGKSVEIQQKLHDDYYTALLGTQDYSDNANYVYNLSTSSLTGKPLDVYKFVNQSALLISELKKALPTNAFLRLLKPEINGTLEQQNVKMSKPSIVTVDLSVEPDGEMIETIRKAFLDLPGQFKFSYNEIIDGKEVMVSTEIASVQDIILGHLLHTQGVGLGGFSFSKLLPVETAKSFDSVFAEASNFNPINLQKFSVEAKLNIPELTKFITDQDIKAADTKGHYLLWSKNVPAGKDWNFSTVPGRIARRTRADGGEQIIFHKSKEAANANLFQKIAEEGVVRMKDAAGKERTYVVSDMIEGKVDDKYRYKALVLDTVNFRNFPRLKQYNSVAYSGISNAALEAGITSLDDEQEAAEPEIAQIGSESKTYLPVAAEANTADVKNGQQISFVTDLDIPLSKGQIISLQTEEGDQLLVRVKAVWDVNEQFNRAIKENPATASARTLEWAIKVTYGHVGSLSQILDKKMVDMEYVNDANRGLYDNTDDVIDYNISEYNPKSSEGLYKGVMKSAGEKMKTLPTFLYESSNPNLFFDTLYGTGFDAMQVQTVRDFITNKGIVNANTDDISDMMIEMAVNPASLEHYNTATGFDRNRMTPLEKFHEVAVSIFGEKFNDIAVNFADIMNKHMAGDETMINEDTMQPYTYYEWLNKHYGQYVKYEDIINEMESFYTDNDMVNVPFHILVDDYSYIRQKMGQADGLIYKNHKGFIEKLGGAIGARAEERSFDIITSKNPDYSPVAQQDISTWQHNITSITDLTDKNAAVQELGRGVQIVAQESNAEKLRVQSAMQSLMSAVVDAYYAEKPKSFKKALNIFSYSKESRDPFDYLLDRDINTGDYSGMMKARYAGDEKGYRDEIFETVPSQDGQTKYFAISNKATLNQLHGMSNIPGLLTENEKAIIRKLDARYNGYNKYKERIESASKKDRSLMSRDTSLLRNLWVKAKMATNDSADYAALKAEAGQFAGTEKGRRAEAQMKLWDFLYNTSNDLLRDTGYYSFTVERGMMPQTAADFMEVYSRYGLVEARKEFLKDHSADIDRIMTEEGVIVGEAPVMNFQNTKKVPYRTLRKKDTFSVNVPAIFAHHFNTLIFKKHYDQIVPVADAILEYYKAKRTAGGQKFENIEKLINEWAAQHIFFQKGDARKTKIGKAAQILSNLTVTQFLGFAPLGSFINWSVGNLETWKHLVGDYGFTGGTSRVLVGLRRLHGVGFSDFSRMTKDSKFVYHPKALAIMKHYGIETFVNSQIDNYGDLTGKAQDIMLMLQQNSEIMIRGAAFFAEMTDSQWDAFQLNADGTLTVGPGVPDALTVAEWRNKIGSIQGKYDDEMKRLYQGDLLLTSIFLFKGWLIDYGRNRVGTHHFDQFGYEREGYYRTTGRLVAGSTETNGERQYNYTRLLEYFKGKDSLTELEQANLRKIAADMMIKASILLMGGVFLGGNGDDKENALLEKYLSKLNTSMFLLTQPLEVVSMIKNPFAAIHDLEAGAKLIDAIITLNEKQAIKAGYQFLPGKQVIEAGKWVMENADDNEVE